MTPESSRFNEQRTPAIVQRRMSTFRRRRRSNDFLSEMELSPVVTSSSRDGTLYDLSSEMALYDGGSGDAMSGCDEEDGGLSMERQISADTDLIDDGHLTSCCELACDCYLQLIITPSEVTSSFRLSDANAEESGVFGIAPKVRRLRLPFADGYRDETTGIPNDRM
jgi:hypothetical protein